MNFIVRMRVKMYVVRARLHGEKRRPEISLQFAGCVYTVPDKFFNGRLFFTCATRFHGTLQLVLQIAVLSVVKKLTQFRGSRVNKSQNRASFLSVQKFFPELFLFFQHLFFLSSLIKTKCHQTVVRL